MLAVETAKDVSRRVAHVCSVLSVALMTSPSHLTPAVPTHVLPGLPAPLCALFPGLTVAMAWTGGFTIGTEESDTLPGRPWFPSCCYRGVMHATGRRRDIERHWRSRRGLELPVHAPNLCPSSTQHIGPSRSPPYSCGFPGVTLGMGRWVTDGLAQEPRRPRMGRVSPGVATFGSLTHVPTSRPRFFP